MISKAKQRDSDRLTKVVMELYGKGYSTREISAMIEKKRSHVWIHTKIKEAEDLKEAYINKETLQ